MVAPKFLIHMFRFAVQNNLFAASIQEWVKTESETQKRYDAYSTLENVEG